jgi:ubiquinone/menaquinone biosynthesis C-methylase UbiE
LARELAHHEELYSGAAQELFSKPAVRALRQHISSRVLEVTRAGSQSAMLSLGSGIGDTEILLAPKVGHITGVDLSPKAIQQAREDAQMAGLDNLEFVNGSLDDASLDGRKFDCVIGIFFLHHVPDHDLVRTVARIRNWLKPGGTFYGLDPNHYRLSGAIGSLVMPRLMQKYQTPDERELRPADTVALFRNAGFQAQSRIYDFTSTPLAGLFPSSPSFYSLLRAADEVLIRTPLLKQIGSNFELIARY